jgi:hypothetical protein
MSITCSADGMWLPAESSNSRFQFIFERWINKYRIKKTRGRRGEKDIVCTHDMIFFTAVL